MKFKEISLNEMRNRRDASAAAEAAAYAALTAAMQAAAGVENAKNLAAIQAAAVEWTARRRRARAVDNAAHAQWARDYY